MANTYIVNSLIQTQNIIIVNGTVNGTPVQVNYLASVTFPNVSSFQSFIAPIMLAAVPQTGLSQYTGTFSL
jgi:hypothetical protein